MCCTAPRVLHLLLLLLLLLRAISLIQLQRMLLLLTIPPPPPPSPPTTKHQNITISLTRIRMQMDPAELMKLANFATAHRTSMNALKIRLVEEFKPIMVPFPVVQLHLLVVLLPVPVLALPFVVVPLPCTATRPSHHETPAQSPDGFGLCVCRRMERSGWWTTT